jgi:hypothetical protein
MKTMRIICIALCFVIVPFVVFGSVSTITTNGTGGGLWNSTTTWVGGVVPTGGENIIIAATDSIVYNVPVTISYTLTKNSSKKDSMAVGGSITFANGSTYIHAANGGSIPIATWQTGSTCTLTGITGLIPANSNQNFYNFNFNGKLMTGNLNLGWNNNVIGGNVDVTGLLARALRLTNDTFGKTIDAPNVITINGNVTVHDTAYFTASGSSNNVHYVRVIIGGNFTVNGGTGAAAQTMFQAGNSSQCYASFLVKGNVTFAACTTNTNNTYQDTLAFCGTSVQTLTNTVDLVKLAVVVYPGSTLLMENGNTLGAAVNSFFILNSGAWLACRSTAGIVGNITTPLANTFLSKSANYALVGTAGAQVTSALMPDTVNNLDIDNTAGVTNSQALTVTDTLRLKQGYFNDCAFPVTVAAGKIQWLGGSMCSVGVEEIAGAAPREFKLQNNFPNPFNPSTELRFSVPVEGYATLKVFNMLGQEVATLFDGVAKAGSYNTVTFDASKMASGVYFARLQQNSNVKVQRMVLTK